MKAVRLIFVILTLVAIASFASASIVANTATVLPAKTFSVTGGVQLFPNAGNFNFGGGLGLFGMACMGLGNSMDVAVKYVYSSTIGADLEYNLLKDPKLFNLSADVGASYTWTANGVLGVTANLLASKKFFDLLDPYLAVEYGLNLPLGNNSALGHSLDLVVGVDIKIITGLSLLAELDVPLYNSAMSVVVGLCYYTGDKPLF